MHALAEHVLCPARHRANGKIGLRFTRNGFGTPFFGADEQVRVEGTTLVHSPPGSAQEKRGALTTLGAAASAIGIEAGAPDLFKPATPLDLDRPLDLDAAAVGALGWWYGFAAAVLAQLRADAASNASPSPPSLLQLWPEHFDIAVEIGNEGAELRAALGGSPGDGTHPEPYLYVAPWIARPEGELWQAAGFPGAELSYAELLAAPDQRAAALEFFRVRLAALNA
jgi:hypothetical protein